MCVYMYTLINIYIHTHTVLIHVQIYVLIVVGAKVISSICILIIHTIGNHGNAAHFSPWRDSKPF